MGIKFYTKADFSGGWNQDEVTNPGLVLYITFYVITYADFPIIWEIWLQTEISINTTEAKYIALSQAMRGVLPFVSLMKDIELLLEFQCDTPKVLCNIFQKLVTDVG